MSRPNEIDRLNALVAALNEVNATFSRAVEQCEALIYEELAQLSQSESSDAGRERNEARHRSNSESKAACCHATESAEVISW